MLEEGIYIAPSQFEAGFMSAVHTEQDIDQTIEAQARALKQAGVTATFTRVGSMFSMFFTDQEIVSLDSVKTSDTDLFKRYFNAMLEEGIYIAPSQFEAGFMSAAHTDDDIDQTIEAQSRALQKALG